MPDEDKTSSGSLGLDLRILMASRAHTLVREVLTQKKTKHIFDFFLCLPLHVFTFQKFCVSS